jgi:preprotein translocase subunit YajC
MTAELPRRLALPFFGASRTNSPLHRCRYPRSIPMLISTAHAQTMGGMFDGSNAMIQFLPLVLIFVVFYFLLIRPQQKKQKDHRSMLDTLRRGDRVVTGGGIIGTVNRVASPEEVEVDIAQGVRVRVLRSTITTVLAKPDPAAAREAANERGTGSGRRRGAKDAAKEPEPEIKEDEKA